MSLLHLSEDSSVLMFFLLLIRYDVIAKMETFSEDTQFTLAQVGIILETICKISSVQAKDL